MPPRLECPFKHPDALASGGWDDIPPVFLKENVTGGGPTQSTWFKTAWNEQELCVFFHCEDTDAWATHTVRDAPLYDEEVVEIFFDPVGDLESYFEIEVNPLNTVCDLVLRRVRNGWRKDFAWDCQGLQTLANRQPHAIPAFWTVEMAIPFAGLGPGIHPSPGKSWRVNFFRIDRPKGSPWELSAWSPTGVPLFHVQEKFGWLDFVR